MGEPNEKTPARKVWRFGKNKKALLPQGKVPVGVKGLTKAIGGELASERAQKWDAEESRNMAGWVSRSPAWAISAALHIVAGVILMNVVYFTQHQRIGQVFRMTLRAAAPGGMHQGEQDNGINGKHNEDAKPTGPEKKEEPEVAVDPKPAILKPALPETGATATPFPLKVVSGEASGKDGPGGVYAGRGGEGRGEMLREFGGDGQSEQAVIDGLAWLAKHQSKSGAWEPAHFSDNCPRNDNCGGDDKGEQMYAGATTALAILAYLGAGYSHMDDHLRPQDQGGPVTHQYTATIKKALNWLCREQNEKTGELDPEGDRNMYVHGIASLAVIEAYSMTKDPVLKPHAQRAIMHIVDSQQDSGGWNYTPENMSRSDASITSWMVMCLRSARTAGLAVPKRTWDRARFCMSKLTDYQTGNIGYCIQGSPGRVTRGCNCMVALGMATRAYLGMPDDQQISEKFVATILKAAPRYDDTPGACPNWGGLTNRKGGCHWSLYYTYYATLALFHHGGKAWEEWNGKMRACTLPAQRKEGHAKGSWDPVVWDGAWGGRVYTTAFNVMNLEVYYRYLPCYQVGAEFGLSKLVTDDEWDKVVGEARKGKFENVQGTADEGPADKPGKGEAEKPPAPRADKSTEELVKDLLSEDMMTRRNAAKELSNHHELTAVKELIQASKVEKTSLRPVLIEYLGAFGDSDAILDYLVETLENAEDRIQTAALTALRKATGETSIGKDAHGWRTWLAKQREEKSKK